MMCHVGSQLLSFPAIFILNFFSGQPDSPVDDFQLLKLTILTSIIIYSVVAFVEVSIKAAIHESRESKYK